MQRTTMYVKAVEIVGVEKDGVIQPKFAEPGTTVVETQGLKGKQAKVVLCGNVAKKRFLAALLPWEMEEATLPDGTEIQVPKDLTIVSIPAFALNGEKLDTTTRIQFFRQAYREYGVPMWSGSGIKSWTFGMVKEDTWREIAAWAMAHEVSAEAFGAYGGLMLSSVTTDAKPFTIDPILPEGEENDGVDGNCGVPAGEFFGKTSHQFRALAHEGMTLLGEGKGMVNPRYTCQSPEWNASQIKFGGEGDYFIALNEGVSSEVRDDKWFSCEPLVFLENSPEVREFLATRMRREIKERLALLTAGNRLELAKRLGFLSLTEDHVLEAPKRAVGEMLLCDLPMSAEVEEKISRFMIREITQKIIPSGGLKASMSTIALSEKYGMEPSEWDEAGALVYRFPPTSANAIIPVESNPYKAGQGYVVTPELACDRADGDADGDYLQFTDDQAVVSLFRQYLRKDAGGDHKPEKTRKHTPLSPEAMFEVACHILETNYLVGAATVAGWKLLRAGEDEAASLALTIANAAPMLTKWDIYVGGQDLESVYHQLARTHKAVLDQDLPWRQRQQMADDWETIRELGAAPQIEGDIHLLDFLWNEARLQVAAFNLDHPKHTLSSARMKRLVFQRAGVEGISPAAHYEVRQLAQTWGEYWSAQRGPDGTILDKDHSGIYETVSEMYLSMSEEAKAGLLTWTPKSGGSGFNLKFNTVFKHGDARRFLGLHPDVRDWLRARGAKAVSKQEQALRMTKGTHHIEASVK